ncbi:hypothetical protein B0H16DRAFT_1465211 [Mycena metata]|uniref:Uncharacterized protein n=1 Tax=Mycena metata TaxID=1033252 RepID=A0AAD7IBV1_9AGAR|nr:hypothetical protein B0H16DRAFT_1465211 [Mycena metata]
MPNDIKRFRFNRSYSQELSAKSSSGQDIRRLSQLLPLVPRVGLETGNIFLPASLLLNRGKVLMAADGIKPNPNTRFNARSTAAAGNGQPRPDTSRSKFQFLHLRNQRQARRRWFHANFGTDIQGHSRVLSGAYCRCMRCAAGGVEARKTRMKPAPPGALFVRGGKWVWSGSFNFFLTFDWHFVLRSRSYLTQDVVLPTVGHGTRRSAQRHVLDISNIELASRFLPTTGEKPKPKPDSPEFNVQLSRAIHFPHPRTDWLPIYDALRLIRAPISPPPPTRRRARPTTQYGSHRKLQQFSLRRVEIPTDRTTRAKTAIIMPTAYPALPPRRPPGAAHPSPAPARISNLSISSYHLLYCVLCITANHPVWVGACGDVDVTLGHIYRGFMYSMSVGIQTKINFLNLWLVE